MDASPPKTPEQPKRRYRPGRRFSLSVLALLALPFLLLAAVWLALRFEGVRRAVIETAAAEAASVGVRLEAADFRVGLLAGVVEVDALRLSAPAPEAAPFLTVSKLRAELVWSSLLIGKPTLRSLVAETPVLDLGAPLPASPEAEETSDESGPPIEVLAYRLSGGNVLGAPPAARDGWLTAWRVEGAEVAGSYRDGALTFELSAGELVARLREGREIPLAARAAGSASLQGAFEVDRLQLDGEGLHLEAEGAGGAAPDEPLEARFELEADPGVFLAEGAGSRVTATGRLDFRRWVGETDLEVRELPAELLEPWLGDGKLAQMGVAGSRLDLEAHLAAPADPAAALAASGTLVWKHPDSTLADATFDATLARAADPGQLDLATLAGTARVHARDLPIDVLAPWLGPAELARFGAEGTLLDAEADLALDPSRPEPLGGQGRIAWRRGGELLAQADVRALPSVPAMPVRLGVELGLLPAEPGLRRFSGELGAASLVELADGRLASGRLALELPDLAAAREALAARWPALVPAESERWPIAGALSAHASLAGSLRDPDVTLTASWRRDGADLALEASGRPVAQRGAAKLAIAHLDLALLGPPLLDEAPRGTVQGDVEISGSREAFEVVTELEGAGLRYGEHPEVERLHLAARTDGHRLTLEQLAATFDGREIEARGSAELDRPLRTAQLDFSVAHPISSLERLEGSATLAAGSVRVDFAVPAEIGRGRVVVDLPLGALAALPDLGPTMAELPVEQAEGLVTLDLDLEHLDAQALISRFEAEGLPRRLGAGVHGRLSLDLSDPSAAEGKLVVLGFELERWPLEVAGRRFELEGGVELTPGWRLDDAPKKLVRALGLDAKGQLEAAILNPFLAGGSATGVVGVEAHVGGSLEQPLVDVTLDGTSATIFFLRPYATKLEALHAKIVTKNGELCFEDTGGRLNEGSFELVGCRSSGGDLDLSVFVDQVRYRLDYGLSATLAGNLRLELPAEGRGKLSGNVLLEQAVIRRSLDLDRLLKSQLFAPPVLRSTAESAAETIDLELSIGNLDGLRVRNNLADLRLGWDELEVRGTLAAPLIKGVVEADPGGLVFGYGQTLRIDNGRVEFPGQPGGAPIFDWTTTSSLEDPTLAAGPGGRSGEIWTPGAAAAKSRTLDQQITLGLAGFVGTQLFGKVGGVLGRTRFNYRPALVFFEDDPSGRLTVAQDLSRQVLLAVSVDLRQSQGQIYILDLHGLAALPGVSSQIFTNDDNNVGVTLQQTLAFGGATGREESAPRLHKLRATSIEGISERDLLRASGYEKGRPVPADAEFDLEVDLTDFLRTHGYPEAEADVDLEPAGPGEVDLVVAIEPGPRARFELTGTQPPKAARSSILVLYRSDFYEPAALEEMRQQTVLALRSRGFLDPQVSVEVVPDDPREPHGSRTVRVHSEGGRRVDLDQLVFTGLGAADAADLAARLPGRAERVELAVAVETADRLLLRELAALGFAQAQILGREISADGKTLRIDLAAGPRQSIAELEIVGVAAERAASFAKNLPIKTGDPLRSDRLASAVVTLQDQLAALGHAEANVRPVLRTADPERPAELSLRFEVEPGPISTVEQIEVKGLRKTRPAFVRRLSGLETGSVLGSRPLATARNQLFGSGLFDRVVILHEHDSAGNTKLTLDLEEKPRYLLSYGLRWESSEGYGLVIDGVDRNFLGRGITLGLRGFYTDDDKLARFYTAIPRIFGTRATLEFFLEGRSKDEIVELTSTRTNSVEGTLQVSVPITEKLTGRIYGRLRDEHIFELDPIDPFFAFDVRTLTPFLGWQTVYDGRDDKTAPTRGIFASADLSGTSTALGSKFEYLRFYGQTYYYRTIARWGGRPVVAAQSLRAGWLERFGPTTRLPGVGFLTGGDYSIRGYETESLGLVPSFGTPIGGDAVLVLNTELRFPVWADYLRGVAFFDAGNAWVENADFGSDLVKSVGLGLRGVTPLGLLRLDVAYPLDRPEGEDRRYWVYVGFGNTF